MWSTYAHNLSKMADSCHIEKNDKEPYLGNGLTIDTKFGTATHVLTLFTLPLKFRTYQNPRKQTADMLKSNNRHVSVRPRLHDTTGSQAGCQTGLTTGCIVYTAGCQTRCQTGCTTGLTTGWMFVYTVVSYKRGITV